ncbi:hypothetical protein [Undibacterium sp. WLX3042]|uniref:hypothetical protein n=1 Tax=Undibacterium sp. WLX3042 TaxID=3412686 RepID=UPI003C2FE45B
MRLKSKILKSMLTIALMFIALIVYGSYDSRKAHEMERQFCASVSAGMPIAGLQEKAIAMGADKRMTKFYEGEKHESTFMAVFHGIFIFDRYICEFSITTDKVNAIKNSHLD